MRLHVHYHHKLKLAPERDICLSSLEGRMTPFALTVKNSRAEKVDSNLYTISSPYGSHKLTILLMHYIGGHLAGVSPIDGLHRKEH